MSDIKIVDNVVKDIDKTILPQSDIGEQRRWILAVGQQGALGDGGGFENFYVIGVVQSFSMRTGRAIAEVSELGSDYTITSIGMASSGGSLSRVKLKGGSAIYAFLVPHYAKNKKDYRTVGDIIAGNLDGVGTKSIDNQDYDIEDLVGGSDIILGVIKNYGDDGKEEIIAVGAVQGINITTNAGISNYAELGTNENYIISSKGDKNMTFTRVMAGGHNVIYEMYKNVYGNEVPNVLNSEFLDLTDSIYRKPVNLMLTFRHKETGKVLDQIILEKSVFGNWGTGKGAGERIRIENIEVEWQNTIYRGGEGIKTDGINNAPGHLKNSNLWLDLDYEALRKPVDMLVISVPQKHLTGEEAVNETDLDIYLMENTVIANVNRTYTPQTTTTVESMGLGWTKVKSVRQEVKGAAQREV